MTAADDSDGWNAGAAGNIYESGRQFGLREALKVVDDYWSHGLPGVRQRLLAILTQPQVEKQVPSLEERAEVLLMCVSVMDGELTKEMIVDTLQQALEPVRALRPGAGDHDLHCEQNNGDSDVWIKEDARDGAPPYEGWCCSLSRLRQTIDALYAPLAKT